MTQWLLYYIVLFINQPCLVRPLTLPMESNLELDDLNLKLIYTRYLLFGFKVLRKSKSDRKFPNFWKISFQ